MTPRRRKRLYLVVFLVLGVGTATALGLTAFRNNLMYFYSPSKVAAGKAPVGKLFRVGGLVKKGSVRHSENGLSVHFIVTDGDHSVPVSYNGVLPDLFSEGKGVLARGRMQPNGTFQATYVLAKHDSSYMSPEVAQALKTARADEESGAMTTRYRKP